ncbi:MAG TPA: hypothetical protein VJR48_16725 [Ktedonobacterales bacterium]|nr:hypothetical protein [Ktedonobacterales bacterium]
MPNDEDPVSEMWRADSRSRKYKRPRFVARSVQIGEYTVEAQTDETNNIFKQIPSGLVDLNNAQDFGPEPASISATSALTCD